MDDLGLYHQECSLSASDDVTEVIIRIEHDDPASMWLQPEQVRELRDWCSEWLDLHATLQIGGQT